MNDFSEQDLLKRWLLILGSDAAEERDNGKVQFTIEERKLDRTLGWVYDRDEKSKYLKSKGLNVGNWLNEVNSLFNYKTAAIMQQDAIKKFGLKILLQEPDLIDRIIPDVQLVNAILQYKDILPDQAREPAKAIIRKVADALMEQLTPEVRYQVAGRLQTRISETNPRPADMDWIKTIRANLRHYQPNYQTIIPSALIGRKRLTKQIDSICILLDQSNSMDTSICHASIFACIFHQIKALNTYFFTFSDSVADLSELLEDPVEVLFSVQLGGSTNISQAIHYAMQHIPDPERTLLILISDLEETDDEQGLEQIIPTLPDIFKKVLVILALNENGEGNWDEYFLQQFTAAQIPCIASNPFLFPQLVGDLLQSTT